MFEFDFEEAERDGIDFDDDVQDIITNMRSFTVYFTSSTQIGNEDITGLFPAPGYPDETAIGIVRYSDE